MFKLIIKRFFLIIIGIILSLVLLECGLRIAGWSISFYQQYKNNKALKNKSQYTIMCLGESTTARQYPVQLQQILDKKYPNKFSVVDCGIPATNLESILNLLDTNINKYKPAITICMMGTNDDFVDFNNKSVNINYFNKSKKINLKIYKLYILLQQHLTALIQKKNFVFAENISTKNNSSFEYAIILKSQGKFKEASDIFEKRLKDNPKDEKSFLELTLLQDRRGIGYKMAIEGLNKNFNYEKYQYYLLIFQNYQIYKDNIDDFKYYINKVINEDLNIFLQNDKLYVLYPHIKDYLTDEQKNKILKAVIRNNNKYDRDYGFLAIDAIEQKNYQKAEDYFAKAEEIRLHFPKEKTYNLYKFIVKKLVDNNIKVICMQYPVRSIKSLQEQLKNEHFYDKITFISNEKPFKTALIKKNFNDLFTDQFAGDFGHCTNLGNTLIAKNVVNTLEKILDFKEKSN